MTSDPVFDQVREALRQVYDHKGVAAPPLTVDTPLDGSLGLSSLDFAELIIRLERATGIDPFAQGVREVSTLGRLADLYRRSGS